MSTGAGVQTAAPSGHDPLQVSKARLEHCIEEARRWQDALLVQAARLEGRARAWRYVTAALVVAVAVVLALVVVVPLVVVVARAVGVAQPDRVPLQSALPWLAGGAAVALVLAAAAHLLPRWMGYADGAKGCRSLAVEYRDALGSLLDASASLSPGGPPDERVREAVEKFDATDRKRTRDAWAPPGAARRRPSSL